MKRIGIGFLGMLVVLGLVGAAGVPAVHARCSDNGYFHSEGKCGGSFSHKKGKGKGKGNRGDFSRGHNMYWYANGYYQDDRIAELLRIIEELEKRLREHNGGSGNDADVRVTTRSATNLTEDSATLRGTLDIRDGSDAEVWFEYGTDRFHLTKNTEKESVEEDEDGDVEESVNDLNDNTVYYYRIVAEGDDGREVRGAIFSFRTDDTDENDEEPIAITDSPNDIDEDSARLRGQVDMNDFENGKAFFVYGEHEGQVHDVDDDFDTYEAIDEDGEDLRKVSVDSDVDGSETYSETVSNLDDSTRHYVRMCVEYEKDNGDETLVCGSTRSFTTK